MKAISLIICSGWAFGFWDLYVIKSLFLSKLNITGPFVYKIWPIVAVIVCFCILSVGFSRQCATRFRLIVEWTVRVVCVGIILSIGYAGMESFCSKKVEGIGIAKQISESTNWQAFQANFNFKVVWVERDNVTLIFFERAVGRRQMVNAMLRKLNGQSQSD
jgi:hypothetical protein